MFAGVIDRNEQRIRYVNAGHPPGIVINRETSETQVLASTGPMISPVFADETWASTSAKLDAGDELLLYTDGVSELHNDSTFFSDRRVVEAMRSVGASGQSLIDSILASLNDFAAGHPQMDDLTLLSATYAAPRG